MEKKKKTSSEERPQFVLTEGNSTTVTHSIARRDRNTRRVIWCEVGVAAERAKKALPINGNQGVSDECIVPMQPGRIAPISFVFAEAAGDGALFSGLDAFGSE